MEKETHHESHQEDSNTTLYYVIGAVVLVAVIAVGYFMRPKTPEAPAVGTTQPAVQQPVVTAAPKPITKFECDKQYYNSVVGKPQYFLSLEAVDLNGKGDVTGDVAVSVAGKTVSEEKGVQCLISPNAERGGVTAKCTAKAMELA